VDRLTLSADHLRPAGLLAMVIGAAGSVCFLMLAAEHPPPFLLVLFAFWVVSPFALLALAEWISTRWSPSTRATLRAVTLAVTVASIAIYGGVLFLHAKARVPFFVLVPPMSWALTAIAVSAASLIQRRR
jgi:hypothetical protein